ncbi:protein TASOR isoform X2 [Cyprinodon tularosa]|uniref:protein TASOR isoform X2 n=1 Tax=Cyprinodon tularosa TaxID=77115 RepID=UPI0018E2170A|nr:protein TASOR isoform X2 [Cyprinodon tularosa]
MSGGKGAADCRANLRLKGSELLPAAPARRPYLPAGRMSSAAAGRLLERRKSAPQAVHQRHMPMEPQKFHIPRKTKEKRALFQFVSTESREYDDMKSILTAGYIDTSSTGCFAYSNPRLVHSELLEKEFVEKRREMKADGRTEKELEESHCFLLTTATELPVVCEKGLTVGQSKTTMLGNPSKGVYLSRYSDLLQTGPLTPGATGELIIFKVIKGKVKSIYENMKILQDPTPRFDSHIAKNASKVTSLSCYRAFDLTQQYFYEYLFDELRERPRQVCPYAVVSFHVKGKDAPLSIKPAPPIRSTSQVSERSKESAQFTVWTGDLVKNGRVLFQVALRSNATPRLPHRLPDKLDMGSAMRYDDVTQLVPSDLFSSNLYSSSKEVEAKGHYCSLLEVTDQNRTTASVTTLLRELEAQRLVLVKRLTDRGFLFLLSSVQMAAATERGDTWKRSLQALFVFPESRDVSRYAFQHSSSSQQCVPSPASVMPRLSQFVPALHYSLVKSRANPPLKLSAGVELQTQEYLSGVTHGSVQRFPMAEYDSVLDDEPKPCPPHLRANSDGYLRSYMSNPSVYLLSVAIARQLVETHCGPEQTLDKASTKEDGLREPEGPKTQKMQQLLDQILTFKNNAEAEVRREEEDVIKVPERKRKLEQKMAERTLKYFKASVETGKPDRIPVGGNKISGSPLSFASIITSLGLKDVDLREEGSEVTGKFLRQLKALVHSASRSPSEELDEGLKESSPFGRLAVKLGLPANCDVDLRKQEELEEQTAGSVSSLEGFSPGSHSGEQNHHAGRGAKLGTKAAAHDEQEEEDWDIPWVLIPITGLCSERYSQRDANIPQDPRFQQLDSTAGITMATKSPRRSPALSPEQSPPLPYPSPEASPPPSPFQCSSPIPSPPNSPSQCPSPELSLPPSPSQCPSPEPSPPSSPFHCPSPQSSPPTSPAQSAPPETQPPQPPSQCRSAANDGESGEKETSLQRTEMTTQETPRAPPQAPALKSSLPHCEETEREAKMEGLKVERMSSGEKQQKGDRKSVEEMETAGEQVDEPSSSRAACPSRDVDSVVDKNLEAFSSDLQLLLQDEGVNYSFPQLSHCALTTQADRSVLPYAALPQFSPYVSFYNHYPPVSDYVSSLSDGIARLLAQLDTRWSRPTAGGRTPVDSSLANTVSDFVASVRAGQGSSGGADDASPLCSQRTAAEAPLAEGPPPSTAEADWEANSTDWRNQLTAGVTHTQDAAAERTALCTAPLEAEGGQAVLSCTGTVPVQSFGSETFDPAPGASSAAVPSTTHINSVIDQLEPNVLNNLAEIIKDIKKKSPQFYVHCTEPGDPVYEEVQEHLLNLGNVHQSPVDFLHQDNTEHGLLVIIKNKDIAGHIHQIPGLMSLKRHASVVFVGIDSLDDIKNNSCMELFVSGGCIVSDELVLNPDVITCDRLAALLRLLEEHSSPESLWRWKIHCKTQKKLKEQARFRRDAANLLDLLLTYQKRQIIEFLPYHHCDMTNHQSPDLDCLVELQARYTQFRHTVYLTEHPFDKFPAFSNEGIIVAGMEEIQQSFSRLVGCHSIKDKQLYVEDLLAPKGRFKQLSHFTQTTVTVCLLSIESEAS